MSLNTPSPSGRKLPNKIYQYCGTDQPELNGFLFQRIAEFDSGKDGKQSKNKWPDSTDEWKYGFGQETVFLMTIPQDHLQPPPLRKIFCSVIETPEDYAVGTEGVGGFIYCSTIEDFKRDFKQKGAQ